MSPEEKAQAAAKQVADIGMPADGTEPAFLPHPLMDAMLESIIALGGELWIERDRRRTLEALMESKGLLTSSEIEHFELSEQHIKDRDDALTDLTRRVFDPLKKIGGNEGS
ncbi:MAG: hypothetical protein AB8B96_00750 [Lysobacterales bacterium]